MIPVLHRRLVSILVIGLGLGQALDSGIRLAPLGIIAIVATAIAVAALAFWVSPNPGVHVAAGAAAIVAMFIARALSPVALPTLALAGWFPVMAALLLSQVAKARAVRPPASNGE